MSLIMPLRPLQNVDYAEKELMSLRQSLRQRPSLRSSVSSMNLAVLEDRYRCCDIYPRVRLDLAREKDRKKSKRVKSAVVVAGAMSESLLETFTGDDRKSKLVLLIDISVVSDGCSNPLKNKIASLFGKGMEKGKGLAKLTVSYCIYSRETGEVALSKQLSRVEECDCTSKRSISDSTKSTSSRSQKRRSVLLELEEELRRDICKEVKFTCCSRLPEWSQFSMRMLGVEHKQRHTVP